MSQRTVQLIVGRLITDEEFRLRFLDDPHEALIALVDQGFDLSGLERDALVNTDRALWSDAASRIHPRLEQCRLTGD